MQLEDDVQATGKKLQLRCRPSAVREVVPSFLPTVRRYMREPSPKPAER